MTKTVNYIEVPKEWESEDDYSSHRELLYLVVSNNKECHPIAEFGSGYGSTPVLRKFCNENGIKFETWDTDKDWANLTGSTFVSSFKDIFLLMGYILFIDGKPGEERKDLISIHKDKYLLIIHDTEPGANYVYGMADALSKFEYRLDYQPEGKPHTTAVSNFIDVTKWVE